ncbi:MAG: hypothetical protein LBI91_07015 [Spirochaetaceae bacterium]|jgi:hypothetical protein|nr:hypothetical protein [Spirochaetaceae bacterium]
MKQLSYFKTARAAARKIRISARVCAFLAGAFFASCAEPVIAPSYRVNFPEPPAVWTETLGPPSWELFWADGRGILRSARYPEGAEPRIGLAQELAVPILARPFWPSVVSGGGRAGGRLQSGLMKSAGAIFPFDADGDSVRLSWEGGVSAEFYLALAKARLARQAGAAGGASSAAKRRPERFNWPGFRALLGSGAVPEDLREDPWLADWEALAAKTVESGWNSSRVKPAERALFAVTIPADGPWFGASPFAPARSWKAGERAELPAREIPELLLSPSGYLKYTKSDYVWHEWGE